MRRSWLMFAFIIVCVLAMHFVKMARTGDAVEQSFANLPLLYIDQNSANGDDDGGNAVDDTNDDGDDPTTPPSGPLLTAAQ